MSPCNNNVMDIPPTEWRDLCFGTKYVAAAQQSWRSRNPKITLVVFRTSQNGLPINRLNIEPSLNPTLQTAFAV